MSPKLIILIEDDLNLRKSILLILQRAGYFVTATASVDAAMDLIQSGSYQLVISDLNIPDTKEVLLPKILGNYPELSIVLLTDRALSAMGEKDIALSANYLVKPLAPERLLDSVRTILEKQGNTNPI